MEKFILLRVTEDISVKVERFEAVDYEQSWEVADPFLRAGEVELILSDNQAKSFVKQLKGK